MRKSGSRWNGLLLASILTAALTLAPAAIAGANPLTDSGDSISEVTTSAVASHYGDATANPELVSGGAAEIELAPEGASGQAFTVNAPESDYVENANGTIISARDGELATFVDPLENGLRIITTIQSDAAAADMDYTLNGIFAPYLIPFDDGTYKVLDGQDNYVVDLGAPWAVDANGTYLKTSYVLNGNVLRQLIDYSGAAFLSVGQRLNLNASPFTFINIPAPVSVSSINSTGFGFKALAGHFDGVGSTVNFRFCNDASGWLHTSVGAHVITDRGAAANAANKAVASQKWADFLANLIRRPSL